ncbi:erythropoietin isoform X2 [Brienomyrus brachyistius]|uniref:erythropoietin isoform X2 n=1 Tax=Brienomyrus brachyistius TaxID=42636 RepID=UPI0020B2614F|nr:erythropoietin isoform X2 [Brienomyrus brachyistius]
MEIPRVGLVAVLLMVLEWIHSGLPSPLRPICDLRVLDRFINEARDMEVTMRSCSVGCSLVEPLSVPLTSVDFAVWEKENAQKQAQEVQAGLWLLSEAISVVRASVTSAMLQSLLDNSHSNLHSIRQVIRSLNFQEYIPPTGGTAHEETWRVSSMAELLRVHRNFLSGKVRLLLKSAAACHRDGS